MGPLIPQGFINPDLNLFFAFVIGLGFGSVLEQAGFSSSRKLAGLFYGYDFIVLRERDSMKQDRIPINKISTIINERLTLKS
jgi:hypothetical protein